MLGGEGFRQPTNGLMGGPQSAALSNHQSGKSEPALLAALGRAGRGLGLAPARIPRGCKLLVVKTDR